MKMNNWITHVAFATCMVIIFFVIPADIERKNQYKAKFLLAHQCRVNPATPVDGIKTLYICNDGRVYDYSSVPTEAKK